ncbi:MAG: prepilin-type N-terminal cleavage/methylation domain-containing protein [Lachnospiraceae bacterium]|nr:prepilin-type N-terminal cleavage/methylation domain-containing protein [Lachnospiraceae bacterium]
MEKNKGFSLVELVITIAIMAVLVGILAPQFIKYVEQSRRSKDIQNAQELRETFLTDIAEGKIQDASTVVIMNTTPNLPSALNDIPYVEGEPGTRGNTFTVSYDAATNEVQVYPTGTTYNLITEAGISAYKAA